MFSKAGLGLICSLPNKRLEHYKKEDIEKNFRCQNKNSKSLSWAENLNKLFTGLGGKFKFSAQDSDLEYLFWQ